MAAVSRCTLTESSSTRYTTTASARDASACSSPPTSPPITPSNSICSTTGSCHERRKRPAKRAGELRSAGGVCARRLSDRTGYGHAHACLHPDGHGDDSAVHAVAAFARSADSHGHARGGRLAHAGAAAAGRGSHPARGFHVQLTRLAAAFHAWGNGGHCRRPTDVRAQGAASLHGRVACGERAGGWVPRCDRAEPIFPFAKE